MATISISGTNKLAERIVSDAEAEAQKINEETANVVRGILMESEKAVAKKRAELTAAREFAKAALISGFQTRAALDGRKSALAKKRGVIDRAFSGAYETLLSLNGERRKRICENLLRAETEEGETIVPSAADRKLIETILATMPEKKLTLSKENASFDGGFLILANGFEKDCSFLSLLKELRGREETNVAKLLFD
ncbi:MAG: hypothetical protein LLF75_09235 [Eubacteriales bacterium]|nr:hypothetical protein [Eubacteriales bacterium]